MTGRDDAGAVADRPDDGEGRHAVNDCRFALKWSEETDLLVHRLAVLTGKDGDGWRARVIIDALSMYEWVLKQQLAGREVRARGTWPDPGVALSPLIKVDI